MNRTVVAVFDSNDNAEAARKELIGAGIPADDIHLRGGTSSRRGDDRTDFWQRTLGMTDAEADRYGYYAEAERRGHASLVIEDVEEREAATIETTLAKHSVLDIEMLADDWRGRGWRGYEPGAPGLAPSDFDEERRLAARARAAGDDGRRCVRVYSVVVTRTGQPGATSAPRMSK